jgi:hypothetical protein
VKRAVVWALCGLLLFSCRKTTPPPGPRATLVRASGAVFHQAGGARQPATSGPLAAGELSTGPDGDAVVILPGGRELELRPNARLQLKEGSGGVTVEIEQGLIISRTPEKTAEPSVELSILTPFGITRVPRGAGEASIGVNEGKVTIEVAVGTIAFVDKSGREVQARAPETIEVTLGRVQLLGPERPPAVASSGVPVDVMLSAEVGPLLVRRPDEKRFVARRGLPAPAGTAWKLSPGGRARIVAPGVRVHLAGAAGRVGEASRAPNGWRLDLTLETGAALVRLEGEGEQTLVLEGPGGPVTVKTSEATTLAVAAGRAGPTLVVLAGTADVLVGETRRHLEAAGQAVVAGQRISVSTRASSDVILPTTRGLRVYADALSDITLSWPPQLQNAQVEAATDPEFEDLVLSGRVGGAAVTLPVPPSPTLYWRVRGTTHGVEKVLLGQARFAPDRRRSVLDLDHPHNLVSETGQTTTVYFQSTLPSLTLAYTAHPGARRYRVRLYRAGALDQPIVERVVTETRCPVEARSLREGSYLWHAVALNAEGRELGGGRLNKLDLVYDNTLTTLAIVSPKPGEPITGREVGATGVAPLGSKLYINGKPAPLDGKGRFEVRISRAPSLVFRLVAKDGTESFWIRKLRLRS